MPGAKCKTENQKVRIEVKTINKVFRDPRRIRNRDQGYPRFRFPVPGSQSLINNL